MASSPLVVLGEMERRKGVWCSQRRWCQRVGDLVCFFSGLVRRLSRNFSSRWMAVGSVSARGFRVPWSFGVRVERWMICRFRKLAAVRWLGSKSSMTAVASRAAS